MASNSDKMAVTVDNQSANSPVNEQNCKDDTDQKGHVCNQKIFTDVTHKKKGTFKITSVTKSNRSGSGEAPTGDMDADSLDDLDETVESHTEDASSEILDSSKYDEGVDQDSPLEDVNQTFGPDSDAATNKETKERGDVLSTRFKVVKIETKEPFRRGRWTCRDSLDTHTNESTDTKVTKEGNSGNSSAGSSIHYVHGVDDPSKNPIVSGTVSSQQHTDLVENQSDKHQSQGNIVNQSSPHMSVAGQVPGQSVWSDGTQIQTQGVTTSGASYVIQPNPSNSNLTQMPNLMMGISGQSNANLPGNIQSQGHLQNPYQNMIGVMSTGNSTQGQTPGTAPMPVPSGSQSVPLSQGQHHVPMTQGHHVSLPSSQHVPQVQVQTAMQTQVENSQHSTNSVPLTSNTIPNSGVTPHSIIASSSSTESTQAMPLVSDLGGHPPQQIATQIQQQQPDNLNMTQLAQKPISSLLHDAADTRILEKPVRPSINTSSSQSDQGETEQNISKMKSNNPLTVTQSSSANSSHNLHIGATSLLTPMAVAEVVGGISSPTKEDQESGSSTVAIDNKIEQAMDLVKSHLMYAVREEVEVLKEQIKELIEKNSQLEHENSILKSAASQETLAKLAQPRHQQPPSSSSS